jgi:amino acid transporter
MIRGISLRGAVAINVATMIGAGPLITIPLVVVALHQSISVWAWIAGALIALCDGLCYAELASLYPRVGGTYAYLREAFGPRYGRCLAFLFVWQFLFWAPLTLATGYIGFAQYAAYLFPALAGDAPRHALALAVGLATLAALYRTIPRIAGTAIVLGAIAVATLLAVALCGFVHPQANVLAIVPHAFGTGGFGVAAFGAALVITLYDYGGYNGICFLGDEVIAPVRTIPRSVVLSIACVASAYVLLNLGVFAALPVADVAGSTSVASLAVERTAGAGAAAAVTIAILVTAFASTYGLLLGASRLPYAAALDGDFLPAFGRLHASKRFPHVSLAALGLLALPASLFPLDAVINALTAGIVLVGGVATNLALIAVRARGERAPFRLPLFPLPALLALGAWLYLFWSTGPAAMLFGVATLAAGGIVFAVRVRAARTAPLLLAFLCSAAACALPHGAEAATFDHARLARVDGRPTLLVDGRPYFFFGGAFFYERIPPEQWRDSMLAMRRLGANTLDLYIPWNWHEVADGVFDFDGRTNPRRNLRRVLALATSLGFHLIVRPGPMVRNEWRNGGYPAWLLTRPDYHMPPHDVLEGRYPATATLQNAHADDAAAEWLHNPTHLRYAARWLRRAIAELRPVADRVIAIQLDDDQGAYADNQTWPAPHLVAYLRWLERQVRSVAGPTIPTFINTYDMKVPSSAPAWAMGNWYGTAARLAEHDRVELDFTAATLTTQDRGPLAFSEFQAGWLAAPEDPQPLPAAPQNTTLALAELLAWGIHGVTAFPLQDTLAPFGWEAPFSNAFYAWDAALPRDLGMTDRLPGRYAPTAAFGAAIETWGSRLAQTHRVASIAIAYGMSAVDEHRLTAADAAAINERFTDELRRCVSRGLTCDAVDLRFAAVARLHAYRTLVVPSLPRPPVAAVAQRLAWLRTHGVTIAAHVPNERGSGIVALAGRDMSFGIASNWSDAPLAAGGHVSLGERVVDVPRFVLPPRSARLLVFDPRTPNRVRSVSLDGVPQRTPGHPARPTDWTALAAGARVALVHLRPRVAAGATAYRTDAFGSGDETIVLQNARVRAVLVPGGGGRLVVLQRIDRAGAPIDMINATGALRDDALLAPPPSTTDRIARYTHSYPAGTFNRPYRVAILAASGPVAVVRLSYDAPDVVPHGAHFEKTVTLEAGAPRLVVDERVTFDAGTDAERQRAVSRAALAIVPPARPAPLERVGASTEGSAPSPAAGASDLEAANGVAAWTGMAAFAVTWNRGSVEGATWTPYRSNGTLTLVAAGSTLRTTYAVAPARTAVEAVTFARAEREWLAANPDPSWRYVGKWRNGIRSRLKSDRVKAHVGSIPTFPNDQRN